MNHDDSSKPTNNDYQKRIEDAAEKRVQDYDGSYDACAQSFIAGAAFVQANPPPRVLALVEALNRTMFELDKLTNGHVIDIYRRELAIEAYKYAKQALANFQKTRGGCE